MFRFVLFLLCREGGESEVRLDRAEAREELFSLLVLHARGDDDIVTGYPVDGGGDLVLVAGLEGVDDAENLGRVAAGGGRVGEDGADLLARVDDEDGANGESDTLLVNVGGVLVVDPLRIDMLALYIHIYIRVYVWLSLKTGSPLNTDTQRGHTYMSYK